MNKTEIIEILKDTAKELESMVKSKLVCKFTFGRNNHLCD